MNTLLLPGEHKVMIEGPVGQLESVVHCPQDPQTDRVAVVCHPHPLHGGTMQNKVVTTLVRMFRDLHVPCIRFNYRGVGLSQGEFDNAIGETDDCLAVIDWAKQRLPNAKLLLAGFSFGSYVAFRASAQVAPEVLISVAPPVHHYQFSDTPLPSCPWIVIMSDDDEVVPAAEVYAWLDDIDHPETLLQFTDAGHFFHGKLVDMKQQLTQVLSDIL